MSKEEFDGLYANKEALWDAIDGEQTAKNEALTQALTELEVMGGLPAAPVTVTVGGAVYVVLAKTINIKGQVYTADQIKNNPALAEALVESGSGMLQPANL
jgi:hypothetical protein